MRFETSPIFLCFLVSAVSSKKCSVIFRMNVNPRTQVIYTYIFAVLFEHSILFKNGYMLCGRILHVVG